MATSKKLHGRAFYESIGSPKYVVAPMVDQSEFAWRMLTRSFLPPHLRPSILAYSPMLHAKLFADAPKYRASHFEPLRPSPATPLSPDATTAQLPIVSDDDLYLDGNPKIDRPLFVQFCANEPDALLQAAKAVQPYCDAVDLNLGCPQGIAKRGRYGAFLQEDWETIHQLINTLHRNLDIPVTAKMRVLETKEKTLEYAKMILNAGASIITVHGRQREQKGHNTGLADWKILRYLRDQLPPDTVMFANGNILQHADLQSCLDETQADAVMSAEGNLYDPSIFAAGPPVGAEGREYWRGRDGKGGYRVDAVLRRYLDIIHQYVLGKDPPARKPLPLPSDASATSADPAPSLADRPGTAANAAAAPLTAQRRAREDADEDDGDRPPSKKQKKTKQTRRKEKAERVNSPNLTAMQPHCFHILRSLVGTHHDVRDALAGCRAGDIDGYERVLALTEAAVLHGLRAYAADPAPFETPDPENYGENGDEEHDAEGIVNQAPPASELDATVTSSEAIRRCKRPFWVCQPHIRPLPAEAMAKGSLQLSKKAKAKLQAEQQQQQKETAQEKESAGVSAEGKVEVAATQTASSAHHDAGDVEVEVPKEGVVCG